MYKVMIVEDEMLVRVGLKSSVDWSKYGMEVAADLPDGQAAGTTMRRKSPISSLPISGCRGWTAWS